MKWTKIFYFFVFFAFIILSTSESFAQKTKPTEYRGLWVTRFSMVSKSSIDKVIQLAKENNFNTLFVQVRGRGDAYYDSSIEPKGENISENNFDGLDYIISLAHKNKIEVHAWINVYYSWSAEQKPISANHIVNSHPEWGTNDSDGRPLNKYNRERFDKKKIEGIYVSPGNPLAQNHIRAVIIEITSKYDIDGIHLDYVRYPNMDCGYDIVSRTRFAQKYYFDPIDLIWKKNEITAICGTEGYYNLVDLWKEWRTNQVTELVRNIRDDIKQINANVKLSAAVVPSSEQAKTQKGQEWKLWLDEKIVDFVVPMIYTTDTKSAVSSMKDVKRDIGDKPLWIGLAVYNQKSDSAVEKIHSAQQEGAKGIVIFSYNAIEDNPDYFSKIKNALNRIDIIRK